MNGPGIAKARPSCGCVGSSVLGYGACGCFTCSECGFESLVPLETLGVEGGEHGPRAYRPCVECQELTGNGHPIPQASVTAVPSRRCG